MKARILLPGFFFFVFIAVTTTAQPGNTGFPDKQTVRDSLRHVRKSKLMSDSYRQSPEDAAKIKALIDRHEQKSRKDSAVVINGISCIVRNASKPSGKLHFLKDSEGKYPDDINLLKREAFKKRLKKLLGNRYKFLAKYFNVQTPVEFTGGIYTAFGCRAHNCADINFMIAYDFSKDILHVGIREDPQVIIYSENGDIPAKIMEWADWHNPFGYSTPLCI